MIHVQNSFQIFNGSYGVGSVVTNMLEIPIIAKCVRVHPVTWSEHIAMRFDLLGCPLDMGKSHVNKRTPL